MIAVTPLDAPFGAEVTGVDIAGGLGPEEMRAVVAGLHQHRFIVIRDQRLDPAQFLAFGKQWGRPHPHALDHLRMPGFPAVMEIGNTQDKDRIDDIRNGAAFWHTDQSYEAEPASATLLHAIEVPARGGQTMIADMAGAYDALEDAMKARVEGLRALHFYGAAAGRDGEKIAAPIINEAQKRTVPPVPHALARAHPITGRKAIYAVAGTPFAIEGMEDEEALALLATLKSHALEERFIYRHAYREGDIAIWDNAATLHAASPIGIAAGKDTRRRLYRISVKGKPGVCG